MKTFPDDFVRRTKAYFQDEWNDFWEALSTEAAISIRYNTAKISPEPMSHLSAVHWEKNAFYLAQRPIFTLDPLFHAGAYYVQEASSMFVGNAFAQIRANLATPYCKILDLCAAPGGKTTHLMDKMQAEDFLVSNEIIKTRANILTENVLRWGNANALVTNNEVEDFGFLESFFDCIVVDAPCSGEGLFRKEPEAIGQWSLENVNICAARQKHILKNTIPLLKSGGYLLYSTCTYSPEENEAQLEWLLAQYPFLKSVRLEMPEKSGIAEKTLTTNHQEAYSYHFYPHKLKGEGLFLTVLRNESMLNSYNTEKKKYKNHKKAPAKIKQFPNGWLKEESQNNFSFFNINEQIHAIKHQQVEDFLYLQSHLYLKNAGLCVGQMKGKDFVPSQDLAWSTHISTQLPSLELNEQNAILYLKKQDFDYTPLPKNTQNWCLIRYQSQTLGWVKHLPNRLNNYYPAQWRIRM
ncbi:MAG: RNA methyltransferase [Cytophagales bacterium]|nr:MAG: RNA methyltransferase [Cytophagales bacterium]